MVGVKRLELLREMPALRRLGVLANAGYADAMLEMREIKTAAQMSGVQLATLEVRRAEDIAPALESLNGRAQAVYVCTDPLTLSNGVSINTLALGARLPTMHLIPESGGLISYGPGFPDLFRRTADFVDRILRGTKPGDIPVEQPTRFKLVINLITAKALGITIPESFLARADEVIE